MNYNKKVKRINNYFLKMSEEPEIEEQQLTTQIKNPYLENLRNLHPSIAPQLLRLYAYLQVLPASTRENHINKLKNFESIAYMNMKLLSLVIIYYQTYGVGTTQQNVSDYLETKYKEFLLESTNILDVDKKLTPDFKRNVKINFASYLKKATPFL